MVKKSSSRRGGSKFKYRPNDPEEAARAARGANRYDNAIDDKFKMFKAKEGENCIRILPRTWDSDEGPQHWSWLTFIHYDVGVDKGQFICPLKTKGDPCPMCAERERLMRAGDTEAAYEIAAAPTYLAWVIDRDKPSEGPQVFRMPGKSVFHEIGDRSKDRATGKMFVIEDPEEGHDVFFNRKGTGKQGTTYGRVDVDHKPSGLSEYYDEFDDWLDYIEENPLPSVLVHRDLEYIERVFGGASTVDEEDDEPRTRKSRRRRDEPEDEPDEDEEPPRSSRRSSRRSEPEPEEDEPRRSRRRRDEPEDEEPEEDEEPPRSSRRSRRSEPEPEEEEPRSRRSRRSEPEEDPLEDIDEPGEDEGEDEDPPERSRGRRSSERGSRGDLRGEVSRGLKGRKSRGER